MNKTDWGIYLGKKVKTPYGNFILTGIDIICDSENLWFEGDDFYDSEAYKELNGSLSLKFDDCAPIVTDLKKKK